jgi:Viral BACON domain/Secretion system C-terminal sorting domain/Trypsin-like peptidase domain
MKIFYVVLLTISFSFINLAGFSQINQGGSPLSFQNPQRITGTVPIEIMPKVDVNRLLAEDSLNEVYKDVPWRFGENIPVSFDLNNSGIWDVFPKGDRIWRLGIKCPGAYTINLTFDNYLLPPGATLFVYNIDKTQIIGAFTDFNNREDSVFATTLVRGEEIVIEYYEPSGPAFPGKLHLNRVTHGYRDAFGYIKSFGQSGSCNNNVYCPEAADWQNQVRSACMLVTGGNGFCSGSLVNNTSQDGTPYILTANHCYSNPATWVFWFNWESPTCPNPSSSPPYNSISGATLKAKYSDSDFCLVQMSSTPPASYTVYYAGWNKKDTAASSGACIHHPSGDIKKISYSNAPFVSSTWSGTPPDSHWQVFWSDGVTEPGSSGSPMFDQYHHVVGQLHGGPSACGASQLWDFYGKFAMSWEHGTTPATRLKDWLDPTNIAGDTLGGFDPNQIPVVQTLNATNVSVTSATLNGTVDPNGWASMYYFDWGTSVSFGNTTTPQSAGSGFTPVAVNANLTGLAPETPYFFRVVGTSTSGTYIGDTLNFMTTAVPTLTVSPSNQNVGTPSGNTQFIVTSNVNWSVISGSDWCTVTPSGTGNDTIVAVFTENITVDTRVAQISVSGTGVATQVVTVTQAGIPVILSVIPPNRNVLVSAGNTSFYVTSNTSWNVTSNSSWCIVTPSGTGNDSIIATFEPNGLYIPRIDTIIVSATGIASQMVTVTQEGIPFILGVTPLNQEVTSPGGSTSFSVTSNYNWNVVSDAPWCTVTPSGTGNGTIVADFTENTANQSRKANILVTLSTPGTLSQTVTVNQAKSNIGISEQNSQGVKIYPNPTKGVFRIVPAKGTNGNLDVMVENLSGKVLLNKECRGEKEYMIDLSQSPQGTYNIIIKTGNETVIRKLVIIK